MDPLQPTIRRLADPIALRQIVLSAAERVVRNGCSGIDPRSLSDFADRFVQSMLEELGHGRPEAVTLTQTGPVPAIVRRAELYFRQHADEPVRLSDAAVAAGCSLRHYNWRIVEPMTRRPQRYCVVCGSNALAWISWGANSRWQTSLAAFISPR